MYYFENVGWLHVSNDYKALNDVEKTLVAAGVRPTNYNLGNVLPGFEAYKKNHEYLGNYKNYAGHTCSAQLEKVAEHFISIEFIRPKAGMTGVDVGSCMSVFPQIIRRLYNVQCYEHDIEYTPGVHHNRIGSSADNIPLPDDSVDFITLHCTFEHFEGSVDSGFVDECARLLKPGGVAVILPLYLNKKHVNITGIVNPDKQSKIVFDPDADHYCVIPEWQNRFGRYYSPHTFTQRIWNPALQAGLSPAIYKVQDWAKVHKELWLRWVLVLKNEPEFACST